MSTMTNGERMVWANAFERAWDAGYNLTECVDAAHRAVVGLRNCRSLELTEDSRAMLEDMLGVSR